MTTASTRRSSEPTSAETVGDPEPVRTSPERGEVVVGVDGSPASRSALRLAAAEARLRDAGLVVLTATVGAAVTGAVDAATSATDPDMPSMVTALMAPAAVLLDAARRRTPSLLVVGARGLGGFAGLLLGSVSESVSRHAGCPVAVVRP